MLLVKTYLGLSSISGIGLFAAEDISKGLVVWTFNPLIDLVFDPDEYAKIPLISRQELRKYMYIHKNKLVLCGDNGRFFNHSSFPNCTETGFAFADNTIAIRDIKKDEELTCDYSKFDLEENNIDF